MRKLILTACVSFLAVSTAIGMAAAAPYQKSVKPASSKIIAKGKVKQAYSGARNARVPVVAKPEAKTSGLNCVQFVKAVSDIQLSGDAWMWWHRAEGVYERGSEPRKDAILVFRQSGKMTRGHVAQVTEIIDSRSIRIDHSNWAPRGGLKGRVSRDVVVRDISEANDWSLVRVWYDKVEQFGRPYPIYGFVYSPAPAIQSASAGEHEAQFHQATFRTPDAQTDMVTDMATVSAPRGIQTLSTSSRRLGLRPDDLVSGPQKASTSQGRLPSNQTGRETLTETLRR
jgi:surface antigen